MEKLREKSFTSLFEDYAPDLCSSSYLVTLLLLLSRSDFPNPLRIVSQFDFVSEVFAFLFQKRVTRLRRVIFKMLEKIAASFLASFFFVNHLFISRCLIPTPSHRPCLSLIQIGESFRPMKFESRPERKPDDDESCLSFSLGVEGQRTQGNRN